MSRIAHKEPPIIRTTTVAFKEVFGAIVQPPKDGGSTSTDAAKAAEALLAQKRSVFDFVKTDITRFKDRLAGEEQHKLELHLESLRAKEKSLQSFVTMMPSSIKCESADLQKRMAAFPHPDPWHVKDANRRDMSKQSMELYGAWFMDLIVMAFACGTRRVATLESSEGLSYPLGNAGEQHHHVSHAGFENQAMARQWADMDKWSATRFGYLLTKLKSFGVLDDTVILWGSEISEDHTQDDCVFVVAGGKSMGIKVGQGLLYPFAKAGDDRRTRENPNNKSLADLYVSLQKSFGIKEEKFGDPRWSNGGLKDVFEG